MPRDLPPTVSNNLMYRLLVQGVHDYAIYMLDRDGTVMNWNAGAERAKGYSAAEIVGLNFERFYPQRDRDRGIPRRNLDIAFRDGSFQAEGWRHRKDGSVFWASVVIDTIRDDAGDFVGFAKITRDLTEQREAARQVEYQASHDDLTGIANRSALARLLDREMPQVVYGSTIAVHYIDLDRFKPVNDTFGHLAGDKVLQEVARRLKALAGENSIVGRLGGDEFAVLQFGSPNAPEIAKLSEAIRSDLALPIRTGTRTVGIGASIGVAIAPQDGARAASLFRCADLALYAAKSEGRDCVRFFDERMGERAAARSSLELRLRQAFEQEDFELAYQPIVESASERVVAYEALLRWTDQDGSAISPAIFVPIAEEIGLMPVLGEWVMRNACREAAGWSDGAVVSVNLSPTQLADLDLADTVASILRETGLPAERLEIEITETAVLRNIELAQRTLQLLRDTGVGIALDDFGTGFSSLQLVRDLPLTRIKIDRSFVSELSDGKRSTAVVDAVLALSRGYDLAVTAEGIETREQKTILLAKGCSHLQGFLFGRPVVRGPSKRTDDAAAA